VSGPDWVIVAVILLSVVEAASVGFFQGAFAIAGLVLGYLLANRFREYGSAWLIEIAAFLVILAAVMLLAGVAGRISRWIMREAGLSVLDRLLGGALGLLRGCLVVALVLVSMATFTPTSKWLQGSELAPYFLVLGRAAIWVAPAELRGRFYQGLELLHREEHPAR
jgi:membrane protein required for colicin V production